MKHSYLLFIVGFIFVINSINATERADKPNIVLIFVDDLGYGDPSCYGGTMVETPQIDGLAKNGVKFTDGYVASPVCGPSRVGLLTGAYPNRFGVYWNPETSRTLIPEEQVLLPNLVRTAGYKSGVIGKWNIVNDVKKNSDEAYDIMYWAGDYWPKEDGSYQGVWGDWADSKVSGEWGPEKEGEEYLTHRLTQHAINFITDHSDEPFFLYVAYNAPHSPLMAHRKYKNQVSHLDNEALRLYAAMVLAIDEGVGRINRTLKELGIEENTLVIFASDNGPARSGFRGYKEEWPEQILGSSGPLRKQKGSFYEGGIRIPFIMKWPGKLQKNVVEDRMAITLDFYPTIANLIGAKIPGSAKIDGVDLMPYLTENFRQPIHKQLMWTRGEKRGAIRDGDFKLNISNGKPTGLYNLRRDIAESNDISACWPNVVDELFHAYTEQLISFPPAGVYNMEDNFEKEGYHPYGNNPPLKKVLE